MFPVELTIIYCVVSALLGLLHIFLYKKMPARFRYITLWSCIVAVVTTIMLFSAICELMNTAFIVTVLQANAVITLLVFCYSFVLRKSRLESIVVIVLLTLGAIFVMPTFWLLQIVVLGFGGGACSSSSLLF